MLREKCAGWVVGGGGGDDAWGPIRAKQCSTVIYYRFLMQGLKYC